MDSDTLKVWHLSSPRNEEKPSPRPPGPAKRSITGICFKSVSIRPQKSPEFLFQSGLILKFAFPDDHGTPTEALQFSIVLKIAFCITREFLIPELRPRLRENRISAPRVPVPKATVDEYYSAELR